MHLNQKLKGQAASNTSTQDNVQTVGRSSNRAKMRGLSFAEASAMLSPMSEQHESMTGHMHETEGSHSHEMGATPTTGDATVIQSARNGRWSKRGTWEGREVPGPGDVVHITHDVTFDAMDQGKEPIRAVNVLGTLRFDSDNSTHMVVQDLNVRSSGELRITGQKGGALPDDVNAQIEFAADQELDPTSEQFTHSLGLFNYGGTIRMVGRQVDRIAEVDGSIDEGSTALRGGRNRGQMKSWRPGDEVLLPADRFSRDEDLQNETRTLKRVRQKGLDFDSATEHAHVPILEEKLRVANLSGNINLTSRNEEVNQRGHAMMMRDSEGGGGSAHFDGVIFDKLGRTDKTKSIGKKNQRMMYPLHFHKTGMDAQHVVKNSVVNGSPGWGFVNHGSNVDFTGNVAYDAAGAGFVTERGDERGRFWDNLAVGGRGIKDEDGAHVHQGRRLYNSNKKRLRKADLGFHGDGFWMASPLVNMERNAAVGNRGNGFLFYMLGIDQDSVDARDSHSGPLSTTTTLTPEEAKQVEHEAPPREWADAPGEFRTTDLPFVGDISDNYSAANFTGMRFRYARSFNTNVQQTFSNPRQLDGEGKGKKRKGGALQWTNGKLGRKELFSKESLVSGGAHMNNEIGIHSSYGNLLHLANMRIGRDDKNPSQLEPGTQAFNEQATTGVEFANNNLWHRLSGVDIEGVDVGVRRSEKTEFGRLDYSTKDVAQDELVLPDEDVRAIRK